MANAMTIVNVAANLAPASRGRIAWNKELRMMSPLPIAGYFPVKI
jgi:hypothetical protein